METGMYSRATGRLKKVSSSAFTGSIKVATQSAAENETGEGKNFETGDDIQATKQHPTGELSDLQKKYIESFIAGLGDREEVTISKYDRAVHWVGSWMSKDMGCIVSCVVRQPNVTNSMIHTNGLGLSSTTFCIERDFIETGIGKPSVVTSRKHPQFVGKYAMHLADALISRGLATHSNIAINLVVMSGMRPVFIMPRSGSIFFYGLTHSACEIIRETAPDDVAVVAPVSTGQNYAFRSRNIVSGSGTGPCITVHKSGAMQYQGRAESLHEVASCFNKCITSVMESEKASRFLSMLSTLHGDDMSQHGL